jgi:hypothetical protein
MEYIKALIIIAAFLIYWVLIYYRFHYHDFTPISLIIGVATLAIFGGFEFFKGHVAFADVNVVYFIGAAFLTASYILVGIGAKKHGLRKEIDITLTFLHKRGKWFPRVFAPLGYLAFFFMMAGTYRLLGPEHIFAWGMIFIAWAVSGIRLSRRIREKFLI